MRRSRLIPAVLVVAAAVGYGVAGAPGGGGELRAWEIEPPYLPPREYVARASDATRAPQPSAREAAALAESGTPPPSAAAPEDDGGPDDNGRVAQGAPTDAQISRELREAYGGEAGTDIDRATIGPDGLATIPATAPPRLRALINAANVVARKPYVYGGGHGRGGSDESIWADSAYDCSGSMSYALASAGYIDGPMASGPMMTWGEAGPGKWVSMYANEGHAFMIVAGLRFDTSGRQNTGTRWQAAPRSVSGFTVRHPKGL